MEWVVTTGRTVDEATEAALDQLGVDEDDLELEILEEPKPGLFGRVRGEARIRARIRPQSPRPKVERRERRRRSGGKAAAGDDGPSSGAAGDAPTSGTEQAAAESGADPSSGAPATDGAGGDHQPAKRKRSRTRSKQGSDQGDRNAPHEQGGADVSVSVEEQVNVMQEFLEGLLDAFDLDGEVSSVEIDDETHELRIDGDDLGLLIGPKGQTLSAVQDLARTVAQRRLPGSHEGRVRLDVGGYRERRRAALERFARQIADEVLESGVQKVLEPMNPADRKVVHDTINDIEGVSTTSEGEEPRRRVVVQPVA